MNRRSKNSQANGARFEGVLHAMEILDLQELHWADTDGLFVEDNWYAQNYPYKTIYDTRGRHECVAKCNGEVIAIECKYQRASGSVDEKIPYVFESWLRGASWDGFLVPKVWILALHGPHWMSDRGLRVVEWVRGRAEKHNSNRKKFIVTNQTKEFMQVLKEWKRENFLPKRRR